MVSGVPHTLWAVADAGRVRRLHDTRARQPVLPPDRHPIFGVTCAAAVKVFDAWIAKIRSDPRTTSAAGYACKYRRAGSYIGHVRCTAGGSVISAYTDRDVV